LVAAILWVARVTVGLAESNGSLPSSMGYIFTVVTNTQTDRPRNVKTCVQLGHI